VGWGHLVVLKGVPLTAAELFRVFDDCKEGTFRIPVDKIM